MDLEIDGRVLRTITVPFSETEVATLKGLRDIKRKWWEEEGVRGSGWHRDLYTDLDVPWGATLMDRDEAMRDARKSIERIKELLQRTKDSTELASMESDLRTIANGLLRVFPGSDREGLGGKISSLLGKRKK